MLSKDERRANARKLLDALSRTGLDFHTAQLAMIDAVTAALQYWARELSEPELDAMWKRVSSATQKVAAVMNEELQTPAECMFVLLGLLDETVQFSLESQGSTDLPVKP